MAIAGKRSSSSIVRLQESRKSARTDNLENSATQSQPVSNDPPSQPQQAVLYPSADQLWTIPESSTELHGQTKIVRDRKICRRDVKFPELIMQQSQIPQGGFGVFAKTLIKRGQWVTEYGGEIIDNVTAGLRRDNGEDTHIRSAGFKDQCIDSRVRDVWGFEYYVG